MSTHTPTPWRIGDAGHTVFGPPNGKPSPETVAALQFGKRESRENAKLIIRSVNSAPKLAEALHALVNAIYREYPEKVPLYCRTEVESAMDTLTEWDAQS